MCTWNNIHVGPQEVAKRAPSDITVHMVHSMKGVRGCWMWIDCSKNESWWSGLVAIGDVKRCTASQVK